MLDLFLFNLVIGNCRGDGRNRGCRAGEARPTPPISPITPAIPRDPFNYWSDALVARKHTPIFNHITKPSRPHPSVGEALSPSLGGGSQAPGTGGRFTGKGRQVCPSTQRIPLTANCHYENERQNRKSQDACPGSFEREVKSPFTSILALRTITCLTASLRSPYFCLTLILRTCLKIHEEVAF